MYSHRGAGSSQAGGMAQSSHMAPAVASACAGAKNQARSVLRCSRPGCRFLVHELAEFGGYYCKRCFKVKPGSRDEDPHGFRCQRRVAPSSAPVATCIPPKDPEGIGSRAWALGAAAAAARPGEQGIGSSGSQAIPERRSRRGGQRIHQRKQEERRNQEELRKQERRREEELRKQHEEEEIQRQEEERRRKKEDTRRQKQARSRQEEQRCQEEERRKKAELAQQAGKNRLQAALKKEQEQRAPQEHEERRWQAALAQQAEKNRLQEALKKEQERRALQEQEERQRQDEQRHRQKEERRRQEQEKSRQEEQRCQEEERKKKAEREQRALQEQEERKRSEERVQQEVERRQQEELLKRQEQARVESVGDEIDLGIWDNIGKAKPVEEISVTSMDVDESAAEAAKEEALKEEAKDEKQDEAMTGDAEDEVEDEAMQDDVEEELEDEVNDEDVKEEVAGETAKAEPKDEERCDLYPEFRAAMPEAKPVEKMTVKELKAEVNRRGLDATGCIEKGDLVELLRKAEAATPRRDQDAAREEVYEEKTPDEAYMEGEKEELHRFMQAWKAPDEKPDVPFQWIQDDSGIVGEKLEEEEQCKADYEEEAASRQMKSSAHTPERMIIKPRCKASARKSAKDEQQAFKSIIPDLHRAMYGDDSEEELNTKDLRVEPDVVAIAATQASGDSAAGPLVDAESASVAADIADEECHADCDEDWDEGEAAADDEKEDFGFEPEGDEQVEQEYVHMTFWEKEMAAKERADKEAYARRRAEEEAALARSELEEAVAAQRRAEESAALASKKAQDQFLARKKLEEDFARQAAAIKNFTAMEERKVDAEGAAHAAREEAQRKDAEELAKKHAQEAAARKGAEDTSRNEVTCQRGDLIRELLAESTLPHQPLQQESQSQQTPSAILTGDKAREINEQHLKHQNLEDCQSGGPALPAWVGVIKSWPGITTSGHVRCGFIAASSDFAFPVRFSTNELPWDMQEVQPALFVGREVAFREKAGHVTGIMRIRLAMDKPCAGVIGSYNQQQGCGFIKSSMLGKCAVQFLLDDLPLHVRCKPVGELVTFIPVAAPDRWLRASELRLQCSGPTPMPMAAAWPAISSSGQQSGGWNDKGESKGVKRPASSIEPGKQAQGTESERGSINGIVIQDNAAAPSQAKVVLQDQDIPVEPKARPVQVPRADLPAEGSQGVSPSVCLPGSALLGATPKARPPVPAQDAENDSVEDSEQDVDSYSEDVSMEDTQSESEEDAQAVPLGFQQRRYAARQVQAVEPAAKQARRIKVGRAGLSHKQEKGKRKLSEVDVDPSNYKFCGIIGCPDCAIPGESMCLRHKQAKDCCYKKAAKTEKESTGSSSLPFSRTPKQPGLQPDASAGKTAPASNAEVRPKAGMSLRDKLTSQSCIPQQLDPAQSEAAGDRFRKHVKPVSIHELRATHDSVAMRFKHGPHRGQPVQQLVLFILWGMVNPMTLTPLVAVLRNGIKYVVFGNRRLWACTEVAKQSKRRVFVPCIVHDIDNPQATSLQQHEVIPLYNKLLHAATSENDGQSAQIRGPRM